jgi:hypothetical protein
MQLYLWFSLIGVNPHPSPSVDILTFATTEKYNTREQALTGFGLGVESLVAVSSLDAVPIEEEAYIYFMNRLYPQGAASPLPRQF